MDRDPSNPPRLGVLASGSGSNLQALIDAHARGDLTAPIVVVISNNSSAKALERARKHGIFHRHISSVTDADVDAALVECLQRHRVDVVVLAGYVKRIGPKMLAAFPGRIVNIHPAPLPDFGGPGMFGDHVHRAVLTAGVADSGPTVHLVDEHYDQGPILAHRVVPVHPGDTPQSLAERVLQAEHDLYWRTIEATFCRRETPGWP